MSSSIPPPQHGDDPESSAPSAQREVAQPTRGAAPFRRPRWLVVALVAALVFGAGCWTEGCGRLAFFRGERDHGPAFNAQIQDDADRTQAEALYQRFIDAADLARGRAIPFAAATFVLGAALLALGARGLAGKSNTRSALMQVVAAQAIVVVMSYAFTREMRDAESDWEYQTALFHQHERLPPDKYANEAVPMMRSMRRFLPPGWLVFRSVASLLILIALSRPRSREFFEAAAARAAAPEP